VAWLCHSADNHRWILSSKSGQAALDASIEPPDLLRVSSTGCSVEAGLIGGSSQITFYGVLRR
jgi:hypothetical protein